MSAVAAGLLALRAPWQWRRSAVRGGRAWMFPLALGLSLGSPALAAWWWLPGTAAGLVALLVSSLLLLLLWGQQMDALLRLDHPHAARLVPGHGAVLRGAALASWAAGVLLCTAVAGVVAHGLEADPAGLLRATHGAALGSAALMLYVALSLRWTWPWLLIVVMPLPADVPGLGVVLAPLQEGARSVWLAMPWTSAAVALVAMGLALVSIFGRGGARHLRSHAAGERTRRSFESGVTGAPAPRSASPDSWEERLSRPRHRAQAWWLNRLIARATSGSASVLARAEVALRGDQHWLVQAAVMLPLGVLLVLAYALMVLLAGMDPAAVLRHAGLGTATGLYAMLAGMCNGWPGALHASRREQALLLLVPGMPRGTTLARALAWRDTRAYLLMWLALLPLALAVAWASASPFPLALPAVALSMVAWLWRDHSRARAPAPAGAAAPFLVCLALGLGSAILLREKPGFGPAWLVAWLVLSLPWVAWRWHRLAHLPAPLPAGRLA